VVVFQELMNYTSDQLEEESHYWNHSYAIVHKEEGMGMGITSRYPINIQEVIIDGMHHGLIYCHIEGIDIIATHLWPRFDERILEEVNQVISRVQQSKEEGDPVIVLGDLNALSPEDDPFLSEQTLDLYTNQWKWILENDRPSYRVIQALLDAGLKDVYVPFMEERVQKEYRVDYVFASLPLADHCIHAEIHTGEEFRKLSDHFPVSAEFNLKYLKSKHE
jgi:endonuclease/exonuclease/phosphatase family metal-dependent hydrolase